MNVVPRPMRGNRLVEGLLSGDPAVLAFFPGDPRDLDAYRRKAAEVDSRFTSEMRAEAASWLRTTTPPERLDAFVREGGFFVTTGQQPGLFGGPLYTLYKALTAVALAHRLEATLRRPVLPVFWIASEDHDWEEVRSTWILDPANELVHVELPPRGGSTPALHRMPLGDGIEELRRRFLSLLPDTEFLPRWKDLLEASYPPTGTMADGLERVLGGLLGPSGLSTIQGHEPGLKARSRPLLLRELAESRERLSSLAERGRAIEAAGHRLQVPILDDASNVFLEGPAGRERLLVDGDAFRLRSSGARVTLAEIEARAADDPLVLSPNVLLRPVVESAFLPTLAYVGGPAEVAYHPEAEPIFRAHGVGRPLVHPRAGFTLVETKIEKVLRKLDLEPEELAGEEGEVTARVLRASMPSSIRSALDGLRATIEERAAELDAGVGEVDPTLRGPIDTLRSQGRGLVDDVERKVVQSLKRENDVLLAQVTKARGHLFPRGLPQERVFGPFYYLARYDVDFLSRVGEAAAGAVLPPPTSAG